MGTSGRDFVLEVIEKYRSHECLWNLSSDFYRDRTKRNSALDDILTLFRTKDSAANRETVLKKIQSMRSSYNKELRKVKASMTTGSDPESVHTPKLWYYNHLCFLQDQDVPRKSSTISSVLDDLPFGEDETMDPSEDVGSPSSSNSSSTALSASSKFKRPQPKVDLVLEKIAKRVDSAEKPKRPHDAYGEHVAEKLRSIDPSMVPFLQKVINDAIFLAEMKLLNATSQIVTRPAPSTSTPNKVMDAFL